MSSAPLFKKKASARRDVRPRNGDASAASHADDIQASSEASSSRAEQDENDEISVVVSNKKRRLGPSLGNPLLQGTLSSKTGSRSRRDDADSDDEDEDLYGGVAGFTGATGGIRNGAQSSRNDATRASDWYDEDGKGAVSMSNGDGGAANSMDGVYRGKAGYNKYTTEHDSGASSKIKAAAKGPVKGGSSNVRTITMVDYQPDVCKDYKETGYCGFGDTCKFLHDRSDYLAGWQLDSLSNGGRRREALLDDDEAGDEEEDDIPFACLICRQPFKDPVVTKCGHFFCSGCAIKRFAKTSKCFACGAQTQGIFNSAQRILDRMEKVRALKQEEREEKRWDREDVDAKSEDGAEQVSGELLEGVEIGSGDDDE